MINISLSIEEVNLILRGLSKLPLETSIEVFTKIKNEGERQVAQKQESQEPQK